MSFLGYPRENDTAGVRNEVLVLPGGLVSSKICEFVNGTRTMITADCGSGRTRRDRETIGRILAGLGKNPNVAAVILHGISLGAGYPELDPNTLAEEIAKTGKPVEVISAGNPPDAYNVIQKGIRTARQMVRDASNIRRERFDDGYLSLGVKCGRSDATSGIAGNPTIGHLYDHVVGRGGTAFFGENTEIIGAEHILATRTANEEVGKAIVQVALDTEERAKSYGEDIRSINPVPSNIAGGITTLEEKSLGAIAKAGTAPIQGVLEIRGNTARQGPVLRGQLDDAVEHLSGVRRSGCHHHVLSARGRRLSGRHAAFAQSRGRRPARLGHGESQYV